MAFTAQDVQALREKTGCGMMDCKKALTEADGNMDKAVELLREKGLAAAAKKSGRIAAEGIVVSVIEGKVGAVVEVNAETDFVAKNEQFIEFANTVAKTVIEKNPASVEDLENTVASGETMTVIEMLREKILTIGENMKVRRFARLEGNLVAYVHGGGRIGVMVRFDTAGGVESKPEFVEFAKDIAMQVAAAAPSFLNKDGISAEELSKEKEILLAQALNEGKPEAVATKMVEGRINKYYKDVCLVEQAFIKDGEISVAKHCDNVAKALGGEIKIAEFVRFEKGEGIEKRADNFADEVASMVK